MYSMWAMTCWPFLSALQMMSPGSGCLESSYQAAFPIRARGTLSFFRLWTCRYSLGSVFCAGIMCAMLPGSLLLVTSMGVVMFLLGFCGESVLVLRLYGVVYRQVSLEALKRSSGRHRAVRARCWSGERYV